MSPIAAWILASLLQEDAPENEPRFHPVLLEAAAKYRDYGKVEDRLRLAPTLCVAPPPPAARLSASKDESTHGRKLYWLFAWDAASYLKFLGPDAGKERNPAPKHEGRPALQVLVKESWAAVPKEAEPLAPDRGEPRRFVRHDGKIFAAGEKRDLFVMVRLAPSTEGTDRGWVYGTLTPDGRTPSSAGRVRSCMACHETAGEGRTFGLPKVEAAR